METPDNVQGSFSNFLKVNQREDTEDTIEAERVRLGEPPEGGDVDVLRAPDYDASQTPPAPKFDEHTMDPETDAEDEGEGAEESTGVAPGAEGMFTPPGMAGIAASATKTAMQYGKDVVPQFAAGMVSDSLHQAAAVATFLTQLPLNVFDPGYERQKPGATMGERVKAGVDASLEEASQVRNAYNYPEAKTGVGHMARFVGNFIAAEAAIGGVMGEALPFFGAGVDLALPTVKSAGWRAAAKALPTKIYNSSTSKHLVAGAFADAAVASEMENLSSMLHGMGYDNAVINALRYEPEDPKIERMFKSMVEGMMLGQAVGGVVPAVKGVASVAGKTVDAGVDAVLKLARRARRFNSAPEEIKAEARNAARMMQEQAVSSTGAPGVMDPPDTTMAMATGRVVDDGDPALAQAMTPETTAQGTIATNAFVKNAKGRAIRAKIEQAWAEGKWKNGDVIFRHKSREFFNRVVDAYVEVGRPLKKSEIKFIRKMYENKALRWGNQVGAPPELYFKYRFGDKPADAIRTIAEADINRSVTRTKKSGGTTLLQDGKSVVAETQPVAQPTEPFNARVADTGISVPTSAVREQLSRNQSVAGAIRELGDSGNANSFARIQDSPQFDSYLEDVRQLLTDTYGDAELLLVRNIPGEEAGVFGRVSTGPDVPGAEMYVRADDVLGIHPNGDLIINRVSSKASAAEGGIEAAASKLFQSKDGANIKGSISFLDDAQVVIRLVKGRADYTTFIHESSHLFLRDLEIMPDAPVEELYKWAGVEVGVDYRDWPVEAQEKWARGFERYCTEGKLPEGASAAMGKMFKEQKKSMAEVYGKIIGTEIDVDLDPKVSEFMGKILTGDTKGLTAVAAGGGARFGLNYERDAEGDVFVNYDRMHDVEDLRAAIQEFANLDQGIVDKMVGGTRTFADVKQDAANRGLSLAEALNLPPSMSDSEAWSVRNMEVASARTVIGYAARARLSKSPEDLLSFRRSITLHRALNAQVRAQGKYAARLLGSRRMMARDSKEKLEAIEHMIRTEGTEDILDLANKIEILGDPEKVSNFVKNIDRATASDVLHEVFINNILSGIATFGANVLGNTTTLAMTIVHLLNGRAASKLFGTGDEVYAGEAMASIYGMFRGVSEGWVLAKDAFRDDFIGAGKYEAEMAKRSKQTRSITSGTFGVNQESNLGAAIDAIGAVWRGPTRSLRSTDVFYNTIGYRMELHRLAYRDAMGEFVKNGKAWTQEEVGKHMAAVLTDPPIEMIKSAKEFAKKQTFVDEFTGEFANWIKKASSVRFARNFFPFMHTPMKIFQYSLENTPLAPLSREFRTKLMSKDANVAYTARAQYALANALFFTIGDLYDRKMVVGSFDSANIGARLSQRRSGILPCSVKLGDKSVQLSRVEPIGSSVCMMIDVWSAMDKMELADTGQLAFGVALHLMDTWQDKAALRTFSDFSKAMNDGRADMIEGILGNLVYGHVVPFAGLVSQVERILDPADKDTSVSPADPGIGWINRILNESTSHIPFASEAMGDKVNLWGVKQSKLNGLDDTWVNRAYAGMSPISIGKSEDKDLAVYDGVLQASGEYPLMPEKQIGDYTLTSEQYRGYVTRSGTLARSYLKQYWPAISTLPVGDQADMIRKVISNTRAAAKAEFASKLPAQDQVRAMGAKGGKAVSEKRMWGMEMSEIQAIKPSAGGDVQQ